MGDSTGALLTSLTVTVKELVALRAGVPSSMTFVMNTTPELGPWASVGVQVMIPLALMVALVGPARSWYVRLFAGRSMSVAVLVTMSVANSLTVWLTMPGRVGALLTSLTVTVNVLVALRAGVPLSVTLVVNTTPELGPWASVGVQVMIPLALMVALVGPARSWYVRLFAGRSMSVAVLVTMSVANSLTVWLTMPGRVGALLTSLTVTVKELVALRAGVPLSVTLVVNTTPELGPWASVGVQEMIPLALMTALVGPAKS